AAPHCPAGHFSPYSGGEKDTFAKDFANLQRCRNGGEGGAGIDSGHRRALLRMDAMQNQRFKKRSAELTFLAWRNESYCPAKETIMSTISARRGFFRSAMNALIAARQREASRYVSGVLLGFDDETLKANGYDREELKKAARSRYV
ncbi:hypothetical protein, partial [Mesorhizobium sp.]|uniref:hypothetical protein n=1 Tax=Mesorhizobium sp. TaxID=1871066 RepID=UPI00338E83CF